MKSIAAAQRWRFADHRRRGKKADRQVCFRQPRRQAANREKVRITLINDMVTPIGAFQKLREFNPVFLLESVGKTGSAGRFSYIGLEPVKTVVHALGGAGSKGDAGGLIAKLRSALSQVPDHREILQRIPAGFVGMTPFEAILEFSPSGFSKTLGGCPAEAVYVLPRFIIAFDHLKKTLSIEQVDRENLDESEAAEIVRALRGPLEHPSFKGGYEVDSTDRADEAVRGRIGAVQRAVGDGKVYQAVVSKCIRGRTDIDPFQIYRALRSLFPSPYLYFLNLPGRQVIGSSPETLVRLEGGSVQLRPLSGFRPCGDDEARCERLGGELLADPLENPKHHVFVEQARNDCYGVCEPGSVRVTQFKAVERSVNYIGLRSVVTGVKAGRFDQFDVYRSAFPAGTVAGAPKREAAELVLQLDGETRGVYGGSVGYFSVNNTMEHAIAVRTIVVENGCFTAQAGAVITAATNPEQESANIACKCLKLLEAFEVGRDLL